MLASIFVDIRKLLPCLVVMLLCPFAQAPRAEAARIQPELPAWAPFLAELSCPDPAAWDAARPRRSARLDVLHGELERWERRYERSSAAVAAAEAALGEASRAAYPGGREEELSGGPAAALEQRRLEQLRLRFEGAGLDFLLGVAGWELDAPCALVRQARRARRGHGGHWPWASEPREAAHPCEPAGDVPCAVICVDAPIAWLRRVPVAP